MIHPVMRYAPSAQPSLMAQHVVVLISLSLHRPAEMHTREMEQARHR